jgi:pimeloyl-ACP methyl ester carboxylesterase
MSAPQLQPTRRGDQTIMSQSGTSLATWPDKGSGLGVGSWLGETARMARVTAFPPRFPGRHALPRGDGQGVLVIPGFLTSDGTTARLRTFLWRVGYRAEGWQAGANLGPSARAIERLKSRVEKLADDTGAKVAVAGVSLGGVFAREVAKMMPDHVAVVATLCSPIHLPVPTPLAPFVWALQGGFDAALVSGAVNTPAMPSQKTLAIFSRSDGIVGWQACVPADQANVTAVEIEGAGHTTIGSNPLAQAALARFLAEAFA